MSSNQYLIDAASRHAVFVQRYSAGLELGVARKVRTALLSILGLIGENEAEIRVAYRASLENIAEDIVREIVAFGEVESEFYQEMIRQGSKAQPVSPENLEQALMMRTLNMESPVKVRDALTQYGDRKADQVIQAIRDGAAEGMTSQQIQASVKALIPLQTRQAASLVRTVTNSASTSAAMKTFEANIELFEGYEWVSTLDGRTSHICMARDGKIYDFNANNPVPPAHWSCRSVIIPKVKREYDLLSDVSGERPSVGADGAKVVSGATTYGGWLRKQPKEFQDEVLGPVRAKLFRAGGLSIDKFVDASGRTYTLEQLKSLFPLAFQKANID